MGGTKQKKYEKGAATAFISRNKALKKLQVGLPDFRVLCIFKGIYPVEPLHQKKVNKGSSEIKTYYNLKDIQFLAHDNLIARFREKKHYIRRLKKAVAKGNKDNEDVIRDNKPVFNLTTVIRERYPSFIDAMRDLDDCLNLCFVFSNFPSSNLAHKKMIQLCWKRTVEFQHYIIATKALRKVFVSIKGIYYQANIKGETITWVMGHKRGFEHPKDVDFKVMKTFAEYYSVLLGHINIKLFSEAGYVYPPQLAEEPKKSRSDMYLEGDKVTECLASLALPIKRTGGSVDDEDMEDDDPEVDEMNAISADDPDMIEKSKIEAQSVKKLQNLFKGMKFFLNREVPLQELALVIRCCSGQVSWDSIVATGSTYQESDQSITYHIVDRPSVPNQKITRTYVQPQWVFDCINARAILSAKDYFPGVAPPPHLSPFVEERDGDYVPDDKVKFLKKSQGERVDEEEEEEGDSSSDEDDQENEGSEEEDDEEEENEEEAEDKSGEKSSGRKRKRDEHEEETAAETKTANMAVTEGTVKKVNKQRVLQTEAIEERKLGEMMIPKKHRRLYNKIMFSRKKTSQEARKLQEKKDKISLEKKKQKKLKKMDK